MTPPHKHIRIKKWMEKNISISASFKTCGQMSKDLNLTPTQMGRILCEHEGDWVDVARNPGGSHVYTRLV